MALWLLFCAVGGKIRYPDELLAYELTSLTALKEWKRIVDRLHPLIKENPDSWNCIKPYITAQVNRALALKDTPTDTAEPHDAPGGETRFGPSPLISLSLSLSLSLSPPLSLFPFIPFFILFFFFKGLKQWFHGYHQCLKQKHFLMVCLQTQRQLFTTEDRPLPEYICYLNSFRMV